MSTAIFLKLLALIGVVALGWLAGRLRWLGPHTAGSDPSRVLANAAFCVFVPALLFRTTARIDLARLPWHLLLAYFVPVLVVLAGVYGWQRRALRHNRLPAAAPSVRAITVSFGNSVQVGIPLAAALFGEAGLAIHVALVSLHALVLLTVLTALVELDLAHASTAGGAARAPLLRTLGTTLRNTLIHPVVLPVLAGLAWNGLGWPLPAVVDDMLLMLGQAVVPMCLVLIGLSLAYHGVRGAARSALQLALIKLMVQPALVFAVAHWGFGLSGLPLAVAVMMAALPVGSNALLFAQRYETLENETTAAVVFSTLAFVVTAAFWLAVLQTIGTA